MYFMNKMWTLMKIKALTEALSKNIILKYTLNKTKQRHFSSSTFKVH